MRTPKFERAKVKDSILEPLVAKAIEHHEPAWHDFVERVFPGFEKIAGRFRNTGRLSSSEDERRNIAVEVVHRLRRDDFEVLKRLGEVFGVGNDNDDRGWPWLCRVAQRKALNYARDHAENLGPDGPGGAPRFAELVELPEEVEELLPPSVRVVDRVEAHEVLAYAERELRPAQLAALRLHLLGDDEEAIAGALGLPDAHAAHQLWQAAVRRLRYQFGEKGGDPASEGRARRGGRRGRE